jgi:hypothetical protein
MAEHTFRGNLDAPPEKVWEVLREFTDASWTGVDMTVEGAGVGATRTLSLGPTPVTERCDRLDDDARVLGYSITEGSGLPFADYHSVMTVLPHADGSELVWEATYEPVGDPEVAASTIDAIYGGGFAALKKHVEG